MRVMNFARTEEDGKVLDGGADGTSRLSVERRVWFSMHGVDV